MSNLIRFEGKNVEVFEYEGKVLFNPRDVAECLALSDITARRHIQEMNEKQVIKLANSDVQNMNIRKLNNAGENFLTESGVYKLIFKSRKPEAEKFQDWVTDEVLPMIRQTGQYSKRKMTQAELLHYATGQLVEHERKLAELEEQTKVQSSRIEQLENKVEKRLTEDFELQLVTPTQIGKMFEPALSGKQVNNMLREAGLQWRVGGEWIATSDGKKYSSSEPVQLETGRMVYQLKWQRKVKEIIG